MDGELRTVRSASCWQKVAAARIHEIRVRWRLTSDRSFSQKLCVDARTVAKLNRFNPDPTLSYKAVIGIFRTLYYLAPSFFPGISRLTEERRLVQDAMFDVVNAATPMSDRLLKTLSEAIDDAQL